MESALANEYASTNTTLSSVPGLLVILMKLYHIARHEVGIISNMLTPQTGSWSPLV